MQLPCCGMHTNLFPTRRMRSTGPVRTSCTSSFSLSHPCLIYVFWPFLSKDESFFFLFVPATVLFCLIPSLSILSPNWAILVQPFRLKTDLSELCPPPLTLVSISSLFSAYHAFFLLVWICVVTESLPKSIPSLFTLRRPYCTPALLDLDGHPRVSLAGEPCSRFLR